MPKNIKSSNRHPVDRLYEVREQIRALEADERALRQSIMESGDYVGADILCVPKTSSQNRLDRPTLEAKFGRDAVAECTKTVSVTTLNLFRKADIAANKGLFDE